MNQDNKNELLIIDRRISEIAQDLGREDLEEQDREALLEQLEKFLRSNEKN